MSSIDAILSEIDEVAAMPKQASAKTQAGATADVSSLIHKLASAADELDKVAGGQVIGGQVIGGQTTDSQSYGSQSCGGRTQSDQRLIDKIAESVVVSRGMQLVGALPEAIKFSKTAAAQGHDEVEAFRFFLTQRAKELDC
jgi:hypothetical protein